MPKPKSNLPDRAVVREELETPAMHDESHARDERCIPVAQRVIQLLAGMEVFLVGSHVNEKEVKVDPYIAVNRGVMTMMIQNGLKVSDATYVMALARQAIQAVEAGIDETLNQNMNRVTELVYNLPLNDFNEVTIKGLNDVVQRREKIQEVWKPIMLDESLGKEIE